MQYGALKIDMDGVEVPQNHIVVSFYEMRLDKDFACAENLDVMLDVERQTNTPHPIGLINTNLVTKKAHAAEQGPGASFVRLQCTLN